MRRPVEVVLDTNAVRYFIENPEHGNRLCELIDAGCHDLVLPNIRSEVEGRLGTDFIGIIGAFRSRLRSKLITPSPSEDYIKGVEKRVARIGHRLRLPKNKDGLVAVSAIYRAEVMRRNSVIVSSDPNFLNELARVLKSFNVEVIEPKDLIDRLKDP